MEDSRTLDIRMRFSEFRLPPVRSALIVGSRAAVGPKALFQALEAMSPGTYRLVHVSGQDDIEAVIVREVDLRKAPESILVAALVGQARPMMDAQETLHVAMDIEVCLHVSVRVEPE